METTMHITSRRHLLAAAPALALGACTVTTSNGVTTGTLDTKQVLTIGQAEISALTQALALPDLDTALGSKLTVVQNALTSANTSFSTLSQEILPSVSVSLDTTSIQNGVSSVLKSVAAAFPLITAVLSVVPGGAPIAAIIAAAEALFPAFEFAAGLVSDKPGVTASVDVTKALNTIYGR